MTLNKVDAAAIIMDVNSCMFHRSHLILVGNAANLHESRHGMKVQINLQGVQAQQQKCVDV